MSNKHRALVALSMTVAVAACASSPSWARRARKSASKKDVARAKTASPTPKKYLQMRVGAEQIYSVPTDSVMTSAQGDNEKRASLTIDFQAPLVRLTADRYWVEKADIHLYGNAAVACEADGKPLRISGERLELSWVQERLPGNIVVEAQTSVIGVTEAIPYSEMPVDAGPAPGSKLSPAVKPLSVVLKLLRDEAMTHGRFLPAGNYADGAPYTIARYVVKFKGDSHSDDMGGYSEDGQVIYDQSKRVLFVEARTRDGWRNKSTLLQFTVADMTIDRLDALLREGHGAISYTKPTIGDELVKLGARLTKRSLTSSTYK